MNLIGFIVSALLALAAAMNAGSSQFPFVSPGGVTAWPLATPSPTPSPAPPAPYDVIGAGGPT